MAKKYPTNRKAFQVFFSSNTRDPDKEVALKCLHNSQESIDSLINEAKKYPTKHEEFQVLDSNKEVVLKYLCNSQNSIKSLINEAKKYPSKHEAIQAFDKFLNEVKKYSINKTSNILNIYGISQNPDTKEYIMCWDLNPNNRPNIFKVNELITSFQDLPDHDDNTQCLDQVV
ncbi:kinase-like domain-containing protein [Rhizophagus irregularis DAOM 181602=DAOM 197198]|nr:kinase-like domain-containing protein [Rhizophagus irregularis DAOM 181602=DAOM 197198]